MKNILFILAFASILFSCSLFEPEYEPFRDFESVTKTPSWFEGLLLMGYSQMPYNDGNPFRWDEAATDDAVNNDPGNAYRLLATGNWNSTNNQQNLWTNSYRAIMYVNQFLENEHLVTFRAQEQHQTIDDMFRQRFRGESYALRAIHLYYLIRNHGGIGTNGELLGTPIYNEFLTRDADFAQPRASFAECVANIYNDLDEAIRLLPFDYSDATFSTIPSNYRNIAAPGLSDNSSTDDKNKAVSNYNFVCGSAITHRVSGRIALAFKIRTALLHASPAFNLNNNLELWQVAAGYAAELLDRNNGLEGLDPVGHIFYYQEQVDRCNLTAAVPTDLPEFIWRKRRLNDNAKEADHFPPSLSGRGRINPSQNFVDAFPMKNGYPIDHANANYDRNNPYAFRDPRLEQIVIYDGTTYKTPPLGGVINIASGVNATGASNTATRTGYYLKKLLNENAVVGTNAQNAWHVDPFIRYTEMYLSYAEAANEAWGPDGGSKPYTARNIIAAIRKRGGIDDPDPYLASISNKEDMREMIQNERRIELSFESFRFWDVRRWKKNLTETIRGVRFENELPVYIDNVETRSFQNHMIYGPIPNSEVVKYNFIQNQNW